MSGVAISGGNNCHANWYGVEAQRFASYAKTSRRSWGGSPLRNGKCSFVGTKVLLQILALALAPVSSAKGRELVIACCGVVEASDMGYFLRTAICDFWLAPTSSKLKRVETFGYSFPSTSTYG